mmetsp:Transcript_49651/g.139774  ORF Transcript_49651/g.139774 Transcript_49651/m.139774 type:complete len:322 (-) Transcript_49651:32-997(-)
MPRLLTAGRNLGARALLLRVCVDVLHGAESLEVQAQSHAGVRPEAANVAHGDDPLRVLEVMQVVQDLAQALEAVHAPRAAGSGRCAALQAALEVRIIGGRAHGRPRQRLLAGRRDLLAGRHRLGAAVRLLRDQVFELLQLLHDLRLAPDQLPARLLLLLLDLVAEGVLLGVAQMHLHGLELLLIERLLALHLLLRLRAELLLQLLLLLLLHAELHIPLQLLLQEPLLQTLPRLALSLLLLQLLLPPLLAHADMVLRDGPLHREHAVGIVRVHLLGEHLELHQSDHLLRRIRHGARAERSHCAAGRGGTGGEGGKVGPERLG